MVLFFAAPPNEVPIMGSDDRIAVRRIYCVGRNYVSHIQEMKEGDERDPPFFFQKPANALVLSGAAIPYPPATSDFEFEVELVVAIGRGGASIPLEAALDHVFGYAVGLDMTRRDLQFEARKASRPWEMGKSFDHSAPVGEIVPRAVSGELKQAPIKLEVNGAVRQDADISQMIWGVSEIVSRLSLHYRLEPGDLILTGTPAGVGPVEPGDRLTATCGNLPPLTVTISQPSN
jgi:fumarylpyruvate hydrolase